jgi:hypothetical protein
MISDSIWPVGRLGVLVFSSAIPVTARGNRDRPKAKSKKARQ